jgi:hypothetical protein
MTHLRLKKKSVAAFRKAVELNESNEPAFFSLIHLLGRICDWREYDQMMAKARRFIDSGSAGGLGPFSFNFFTCTEQAHFSSAHIRPLKFSPAHVRPDVCACVPANLRSHTC